VTADKGRPVEFQDILDKLRTVRQAEAAAYPAKPVQVIPAAAGVADKCRQCRLPTACNVCGKYLCKPFAADKCTCVGHFDRSGEIICIECNELASDLLRHVRPGSQV